MHQPRQPHHLPTYTKLCLYRTGFPQTPGCWGSLCLQLMPRPRLSPHTCSSLLILQGSGQASAPPGSLLSLWQGPDNVPPPHPYSHSGGIASLWLPLAASHLSVGFRKAPAFLSLTLYTQSLSLCHSLNKKRYAPAFAGYLPGPRGSVVSSGIGTHAKVTASWHSCLVKRSWDFGSNADSVVGEGFPKLRPDEGSGLAYRCP